MTESPSLPTRATRVTIFEDRAEVERVATVALPAAGATWVRLSGMTAFLDDKSVQAKVLAGSARVLAARVVRRAYHEQATGHAEREGLEAQVRTAAAKLQEARSAAERARTRGEQAREVLARWVAGVTSAPRGLGASSDRVESWRSGYEAVAAAERDALEAAARARADEVRAHDELLVADARLRAAFATRVRHDAVVEVRVETDAPGEIALAVVYRTPGAMFRPEHRAHAVSSAPSEDGAAPAAATARLELVTWGTVWQATGEEWSDVELELSTARPAQYATAPLVLDDVLVSRRKTEEEKRVVHVEAREQAIVQAGAAGVRVVDEMPGVDDGGVPLVYRAAGRVRVASDGAPVRVEIARRSLDARIDVVAYPELGDAAHLRARATLAGGGPLLAGPMHVTLDGVAAGRGRVKYVGAGEPFEIGLGTDDAVRVRRSTEAVDDTTAIMGKQLRKRTIVLWLSNLSRRSRRVRVVERVPVSEIEGLEIGVLAQGGREWSIDADGLASREVDLGPNASVRLTLAYEVRASARMVLPASL